MPVKVSYRDRGLVEITGLVARAGSTRLRVGLVGPRAAAPHDSTRAKAHGLSVAAIGIMSEYGSVNAGVPRRQFMMPVIRWKTKDIKQAFAELASAIIVRRVTAEAKLGELGQMLADRMRDRIVQDANNVARNAPRTIKDKGFDHPLYRTGQLASALAWDLVAGPPVTIAGVLKSFTTAASNIRASISGGISAVGGAVAAGAVAAVGAVGAFADTISSSEDVG